MQFVFAGVNIMPASCNALKPFMPVAGSPVVPLTISLSFLTSNDGLLVLSLASSWYLLLFPVVGWSVCDGVSDGCSTLACDCDDPHESAVLSGRRLPVSAGLLSGRCWASGCCTSNIFIMYCDGRTGGLLARLGCGDAGGDAVLRRWTGEALTFGVLASAFVSVSIDDGSGAPADMGAVKIGFTRRGSSSSVAESFLPFVPAFCRLSLLFVVQLFLSVRSVVDDLSACCFLESDSRLRVQCAGSWECRGWISGGVRLPFSGAVRSCLLVGA